MQLTINATSEKQRRNRGETGVLIVVQLAVRMLSCLIFFLLSWLTFLSWVLKRPGLQELFCPTLSSPTTASIF